MSVAACIYVRLWPIGRPNFCCRPVSTCVSSRSPAAVFAPCVPLLQAASPRNMCMCTDSTCMHLCPQPHPHPAQPAGFFVPLLCSVWYTHTHTHVALLGVRGHFFHLCQLPVAAWAFFHAHDVCPCVRVYWRIGRVTSAGGSGAVGVHKCACEPRVLVPACLHVNPGGLCWSTVLCSSATYAAALICRPMPCCHSDTRCCSSARHTMCALRCTGRGSHKCDQAGGRCAVCLAHAHAGHRGCWCNSLVRAARSALTCARCSQGWGLFIGHSCPQPRVVCFASMNAIFTASQSSAR